MSLLVEIAVRDFDSIAGLREQTRWWSGEQCALDPPRFRFGDLEMEALPIADYVSRRLPRELSPVDRVIRIPEEVVERWRTGYASPAELGDLDGFFGALERSGCWCVVVDFTEQVGVETIAVAEGVFRAVERCLRSERGEVGVFVLSRAQVT